MSSEQPFKKQIDGFPYWATRMPTHVMWPGGKQGNLRSRGKTQLHFPCDTLNLLGAKTNGLSTYTSLLMGILRIWPILLQAFKIQVPASGAYVLG